MTDHEKLDIDPSQRAGRYVAQFTGYRAFIPEPLPPKPPVNLSGELQSRLSEADLALGRLDGSIQTLPDPDLFVLMYVRKEAVLSSQIEGTQSSIQDVLNAEANIFGRPGHRDVNEVINYISAMNYGLDRLSELPVSIRLIREIHKQLLQGIRGSHLQPGEVRTSQNWIGPQGCSLSEADFVPPPPHEVPRVLGDLENFLHSPDSIPFLVRIGMAHAQFETIHPFLDGNGRIGRLLITFLLCEKKVLLKPVLYLSHFFKKYRAEYYERLQAVRDSGDWEGWLSFFLRGVSEVSAEATATVRRILALREEHRLTVTDNLGAAAGNGHRLLEYLYRIPFVSVTNVREMNQISYTSANRLVSRMVDIGILEERTGNRRNRRFFYEPYISIFHDSHDQAGETP